MNDIMLKNNNDGTFDWMFDNNDLQDVVGVQQTVTSVIHAIMLRKNELIQEIYQNKGCSIHDYVRAIHGENTKKFMEDSIIESCREVDGVHDANVTLITEDDDYQYGVQLTVERDDGRVVEFNAS